MSDSWATFGVDLHLDVTGTRVRAGLEDALRDAVRTRRLPPGSRLPSSRALASDLGIARNTVADAYGHLVAEGWLTARQGSGTRVADPVASVAGDSPPLPDETRPLRFDLRPGSPDLSSFPRAAWLAAARHALAIAPDEALGYSDPRGRPELRRALADYLSRARGVHVHADRVVVCSGFIQGLALICRVLRARGATTMALEAYGQPNHPQIVTASGLAIHWLPVDADGAAVGGHMDADAVLLTAAHQFPLGMALSATRRVAAVEWAANTGGIVIEDDYDGEFRYDRRPLGAVQSLGPDHVIYAGTASKSLAPGVRLAWLVLPPQLVDDVVAAKLLADRQTGTLDQLTLAWFIESGRYDRHVRRMRFAYRRRRDRLVAALGREAPHTRVSGIMAGLHAVVELAPEHSEAEVVTRAAEHGLAVDALGHYRAAEVARPPALVVGYGTPPEHAFTAALSRLTYVLGVSR